ncbi:hypothetical protein BGZ60DRAFT_513281 [Tricladium varicosporioides]|nr:hypothetical protein BGZ60DRAFT_513281 [Hymenoscyphus varicosporioides]
MQDISTTTNVSKLFTIIFSILLTLAISITVGIFRASRKKPRAAPLTFRISNIPSKIYKDGSEENLTQKHFEAILNDIQSSLSKKVDPSTDSPAQVQYSFAPSAHSAQSFVATATIYDPPAPSQLESVIKGKIGGNSAQLRVELDFFGLTPLTAPEEAELDIIAVTGLAGHAFGSWKARGSPDMWLRDFLPNEIPNVRILTYGYDTKLPGSQSTASIVELSRKFLESVKTIRKQKADRPIILIGHSLGGLVIKEALVQAAEGSPDDRGVFRSCYAVMFFGVPNRGLETSSLNSMVKGQPNEDLVRNLHPDSSFLSMLHQRFLDKFTMEDSKIICIYETKYTATVEFSPKTLKWAKTGEKVMMVPKISATYASINEKKYDQLPINADHSNIVKFSDSSDDDYVIIQSRISQWVKDAPRVIQERFAGHRKTLSAAQSKYVKALNAPDYASFRRAENPAPGTLQWLLHNKMVNVWLSENKSSFLWVRGAPGQGKTFLSRFVLDHLDSRIVKTLQQNSIIYFFFYDQDEQFQTIDSLLRSLIKQLLTTTDVSGLPTVIFESDPSVESEEGLWEVFEDIIRALVGRTIYCILDALDESEDEKARQRLICRMMRLLQGRSNKGKSSPTMKLLITSRPIVDINMALGDTYMELKARPEDLEIVIESRVTELRHFTADLKKNVVEELIGRAGGTFLWISIVLNRLKTITLPSLAKIKSIIEESSTDLEELYSSVIERIMSGDEEEQKLLVWVVYGRRPLTLKELEAALATQINSTNKASTNDYSTELTPNAVTSAAGIILEIIDSKVHLIHQTAKDFLLKNHQLRAAKFCNGHDPGIYLAKVCMTYLSFEDFETGPCGNRESLAARKHQYPLLHYAARNWHAHIQSQDDIDSISSIICRVIEPGSPILRSWGEAAEIPDLHKATDTLGIATKANILWLAGFQSSDRVINEEKVEEAAKNGVKGYNMVRALVQGGNIRFTRRAVHALARNFDREIMQLLLDRNSDIKVSQALIKATAANRKSGGYVMGLLLELSEDIVLTDDLVNVAAKNKESGKDIIELLLHKETIQIADGAVVAIAKQFDAKVLRLLLDVCRDIKIAEEIVKVAASELRNGKEMIIALLDKRANDFKITKEIVQIIAGSFDEEVMRLLLDQRGDDVKITEEVVKAAVGNDGSGESVMRLLLDQRGDNVEITEEVVKAAVGNGRSGESVMRLLLDQRGDDVKITDEVVKAAARNDESVMRLLLDQRGDDVKITNEVVKAAARNYGSGESVMRLLLDQRGDDVKITDEVVKAAVGNGGSGESVMRLLLDQRGDDVKITDEVVKAAAGNYWSGESVMGLLLDQRGDDVKITDEVMRAAATSGQERVLKLIIERYTTFLSKDMWFSIARFYNAAVDGDEETIRRLLAQGIEPDLKSPGNESPLGVAVKRGRLAVVQLLLNTQAVDINAQNIAGKSPIFWAAEQGREDIVKLLLERDANCNLADEDGQTPLSIAKQNRHFKVIDLLTSRSITSNVPTKSQDNTGSIKDNIVSRKTVVV